jgi:GH15 family glucan-1,4-alpha-glucosidase
MREPDPPDTFPAIGDYGVIGDTRTAALIGRDGSVEWLCLPRFDSPSIFGAILDRRRGGSLGLRPVEPFESTRRYLPETNVLETTFRSAGGEVRVRDAFTLAVPVDDEHLAPEHELLREVTGLRGSVQLEMTFAPRPDYGGQQPRLFDRGRLGIRLEAHGQAVSLLSDFESRISADGSLATAQSRVSEGERRHVALVSDGTAPAVLPPLGNEAARRMERTAAWWQGWSARTAYDGPYREAVARSALALKLLDYSPSGAIVAAPTTSLPEQIGGDQNWDYRYCWLRDAAFTMRALFEIGHDEEAASFLGWMLHATRITLPELRVVYDVFGHARLPERTLPLAGYRGSRPVRVGNEAAEQFQLDVYGEVIDAALRYARRGGTLDSYERSMLRQLGDTVCRRWQEPDSGIWEMRGRPHQFTQSKMLAWVALDRLLELTESDPGRIDRKRVARNRNMLRDEIEARGFNQELNTYTEMYDGGEPDAGVLSALLHGYGGWASERTRATIAYIDRRLGAATGLVYRHLEDGRQPKEGAFGATSFWMVECLARIGQVDEARERFEQLLALGNDLGLFAEEVDPSTGHALGNFPQGLTHIGLINAARTLQECATGMEVAK